MNHRSFASSNLRIVYSLGAAGLLALATVACQPEQRPAAGTVKTIGTPASGSASGSVSGVSGAVPSPAAPAAGAPSPIPASSEPTPSDGIYTPVTYRALYQAIATDYQSIATLTNRVNEGQPLPTGDILKIYEEALHARTETSARPIRAFALGEDRAQEFPQAAAYYNSPTFLDDPVIDAITGTDSAAAYTPAQRRQAIQKGLQRTLSYWVRHYVQRARTDLRPGLVDEAWAIYMGPEVDGKYPQSLSATAVSREGNFNRSGSIDVPLREALSRAQQAAANSDQAAYEAAEQDVYSRLNAIFYLGAARYLNESLKSAQGGNTDNAAIQMTEGLFFYKTIQPTVAQADASADATIMAFYNAQPASLTPQMRDDALAALNRAASALMLEQSELVAPETFN